MIEIDTYNQGEIILSAGCDESRFYIILYGVVAAENNLGEEIKIYQHHDFFGETSILTGNCETCTFVCKTQVSTCSLSKQNFLSLFQDTDVTKRLIKLDKLRSLDIRNVFI